MDWVERSFFVFEHRCLRCFARACGVFIVAIGSYRGRNVVRRAASCVRFDSDVFKFVTSRDTFQVCTGVMPIAKTRGMRSCTCHDLCFG